MDKIQDDEIKEYIKILYDEEIEDDAKGTILEILRPKINLELFKKRDEILGLQTKEDMQNYMKQYREINKDISRNAAMIG